MKPALIFPTLLSAISLVLPFSAQAILIDNDSVYYLDIIEVEYETQGIQSGSATTTTATPDSVNLKSITYGTTKLSFYDNTVKAIGWNNNNTASQFSVVNNAAVTPALNNLNQYGAALSGSFTNTNLLNYSNKDGSSSTGYDYNVIFKYGLQTTDYMVIGERNGNSAFTLQALKEDGTTVIGNDVSFPGSDSTKVYKWNTGYSNSSYQKTQPMWIDLLDLSAFFADGATVEPIFGLKIINDGGADIKLLAGSETSFTDREGTALENQNYDTSPVIPEPSTYALLLSLVTLGFVGTRRKTRK